MPVRGYEDCLTSTNPTLAGIRRELGRKEGDATILATLNIMIAETALFFNVGKQMNKDQVLLTARMILDDFWMLKLEDFKLCFDRMKKELNAYDRMDGNMILTFIGKYYNERCEYCEGKNIYEAKQAKKIEAAPMPEKIRQLIQDLKKTKPVEIKKYEQSEEQKLFNGFIAQFDTLHKLRPAKVKGQLVKGGRFINRYGRVMNIEEFLNYKSEQIIRVQNRLNRKVA